MNLWKIAWRSMQQRAVASWLTAISVGLGVALIVAVLVIHQVVDRSFRRGAQGYDLIVGAKGSALQLVLDTVFYLGQPVDLIPYSYYREFTEGRFVPAVRVAIPICTGHSYKGFRCVATIPDMFERLTYLDNREFKFREGRNFYAENYFEAVAGYTAARKLKLQVGQEIRPSGYGEVGKSQHEDEAFVIVGILEPTGTPVDRAIFLNLEGFFRCKAHQMGPSSEERMLRESEFRVVATSAESPEGHSSVLAGNGATGGSASEGTPSQESHEAPRHEGEDHAHEHAEDERRLSAILVVSELESNPQSAMALPRIINEEPYAQAIAPAQVVAELFDGIVGNVQKVLLILAVLVVIVAGIGITVSIYNSMSERRHEIAIMRALGASRGTVMAVILLESILLSLGGGLLGVVMGHTLVGALSPAIAEYTGVIVHPLDFQLAELILIPGLIALATAVGYLPALMAYRTDVAKCLIAAP
ncbi:MAG: ABC transporter permease [Thermoguttaceae bacterium]|nr:ABC transporter permease [Thermoguttaceae bacterium]MDW8079116.1 ABC transporter permease [Thermoguttaceae bacterium]